MRVSIMPRSPFPLTLAAGIVAILAGIPLIYISIRALGADPAIWGRLWHGSIPTLMAATLFLAFTTITLTLAIGIGAAWLVERTDLPGRRIWRVLLALPLAMPAYVAAICWIMLLRRGGIIDQAAMSWLGFERGQFPLPPIYNLWGATVVIGLCIYPYVYLPVAAVLRSADRALDEAARMAGQHRIARFWNVSLPLILPAAAAGALLVGLYVISDFGTVALLRYRTFTTAIYNQMTGQIDRSGAAVLSILLLLLTIPLLFGEAYLKQRNARIARDRCWRPRPPTALGRWRWAAFAAIVGLVLISLGIPLAVLVGFSLQGWLTPSTVDQIWSINNQGILTYGLNSLLVAITAATLALLLALAPSYLATRYPSRLTTLVQGFTKSAFALPGMIVGLAFVLLLNRWIPLIYGTVAALTIGIVLRLVPQAVATGESALKTVSPSLEHAARMLGCGPTQTARRVTLPVAAPGILAGWALCFITAMKELPVAILLRPAGFDTLPVRIWAAASESVHTQAAPAALLLVLLTMITTLLLTWSRHGIDQALGE
ncbi:MAG: iron ABC transporter permease [Roseiflexaceae bacterium]